MPADPVLSEAFIHRLPPDFTPDDPWSTHRVLGRFLRPFCLWHRLLLETIDSPLLEGRCTGPVDLRRAVAICRCRFREARVAPERAPLDWWRLAGRGYFAEVERFNEYLKDFNARPEYAVIEPDRPEGAGNRPCVPETPPPETLRLLGDATAFAKQAPERIWELPLSEAYYYQALYERDRLAGTGARQDWLNEEERQYQRQLMEKLEREEAEAMERAHRQAAQQAAMPSQPPNTQEGEH